MLPWFIGATFIWIIFWSFYPFMYYAHWLNNYKLVNEKIPSWKNTNKPKIWFVCWMTIYYLTALVVYILALVVIQSFDWDGHPLMMSAVANVVTCFYVTIFAMGIRGVQEIISKKLRNGVNPDFIDVDNFRNGMTLKEIKAYEKKRLRVESNQDKALPKDDAD